MFQASQDARAVISLTHNPPVSLSLIVFAATYCIPQWSTCELTHPVRISIQFSMSHQNSYLIQCSIVLSLLHYCCSVTKSYPTLCNPMDCSTPGFPVHHQLPELAQTHVHSVGDAIQPSHPLPPPSPPAFNLSQHQGLFQ